MNDCTIFFDGGVRGNCGPTHPLWSATNGAWAWVAIGHGSAKIMEGSDVVSPASSNVAELYGCLNALRWVKASGRQSATVKGDSRFVIDWLNGKNRTSQLPHLAPLQRQIADLIACEVVTLEDGRRKLRLSIGYEPGQLTITATHVPRSKNRYADALCTRALSGS